MAWSKQQQIILAVVPKVSSLLSLFGSAWILTEVLTDNAPLTPKRKHPYHRLLLGMSVYDILESVWNFASTWALPRDTQDVWQPKGTTATCTTQGFFLTLSVAVPIYNAFLSLYYVMVRLVGNKETVRFFVYAHLFMNIALSVSMLVLWNCFQVIVYGIPDKKIAERAEPLMHLVAFGWASFTALYSASTGLINNANLW